MFNVFFMEKFNKFNVYMPHVYMPFYYGMKNECASIFHEKYKY